MFFIVKVPSFILFSEPLFFSWFLVVELFFGVWGFFCLYFLFSYLFYWGSLGLIFYGLILLGM
jgi:hypothetical protein